MPPGTQRFRGAVLRGTCGAAALCLLVAVFTVILTPSSSTQSVRIAGNGNRITGMGRGLGTQAGSGPGNGFGNELEAGTETLPTSDVAGEQQVAGSGKTHSDQQQQDVRQSEDAFDSEDREAPQPTTGEITKREPVAVSPVSINPLPTGAAYRAPAGAGSSMFSSRDADERKRLVQEGGGSPESEAAVELGLEWLAKHQHSDGHWSLHGYHTVGDCNGQCRSSGGVSDTAGTALALLPFLSAGHTPKAGRHRKIVASAVQWLINDLQKDGSFGSNASGTMYAQGQATIALCEALAMTGDRKLIAPAQSATDYILRAQHEGGGWRYSPGEPGDTSVTGWQILALKSAVQAELKVPKSVFSRTARFLDSVQADKSGSTYGYVGSAAGTPPMSAEGLLCRMYTGRKRGDDGIRLGMDYLLNHPPKVHGEVYYWYYATQALHHYGGARWAKWNEEMRDLLINSQELSGHARGSWFPAGGHDSSGGRIYATSLCLLTLQVYYRHSRLY